MKTIITIIILTFSLNSFAQSDSTNLPGLATRAMAFVQPGPIQIPNPDVLDSVTNTTETEVLPCPGGYFPNGTVPSDGSSTTSQILGGVVYDQVVTTNRFGTTTYSGWTEVNFLCTAIPPAPTCPSGYTASSNATWDSTTNQWVGLQCVPQKTTTCNYSGLLLSSKQPQYVFKWYIQNNGTFLWLAIWNNQNYGAGTSTVASSATSLQDALNQAAARGFSLESSAVQYQYSLRGTNETVQEYAICLTQ